MSGKKWLVLLLVLVFCLGIGLGMLSERLLGADRASLADEPGFRGHRDPSEILAERLGLSAEQQAQLTVILEEQRARYGEVRAYIEPRLVELRKETGARISELLTEEQQEEFEKLRAEERERMKHHLPPPSSTTSEAPEENSRENTSSPSSTDR